MSLPTNKSCGHVADTRELKFWLFKPRMMWLKALAFLLYATMTTAFLLNPLPSSRARGMRCMSSKVPYVADAWDLEMLSALGFDADEESASAPPLLRPEDELVMREARFHIRSHMSRVIQALVKELQKMYTSRFNENSPLTWTVIRKAAMDTRLDLGSENIKKAEAKRLFLRNTLRKKLDSLQLVDFLAAADVTSTEWRDCRRRRSDDSGLPTNNSKGEQCFVELERRELIARLDEIKIPLELGEKMQQSFEKCRQVCRQTVRILEIAEENNFLKLTAQHLEPGQKSKRPRSRYVVSRVGKMND